MLSIGNEQSPSVEESGAVARLIVTVASLVTYRLLGLGDGDGIRNWLVTAVGPRLRRKFLPVRALSLTAPV